MTSLLSGLSTFLSQVVYIFFTLYHSSGVECCKMPEGFVNNTFAKKDVLVAVCVYGWVMNQHVEVIPVNLVWFRKLSGSGLDEVNVPLSMHNLFLK